MLIVIIFFLVNYRQISIKYHDVDKSFPAFYKSSHEDHFFDSFLRFLSARLLV